VAYAIRDAPGFEKNQQIVEACEQTQNEPLCVPLDLNDLQAVPRGLLMTNEIRHATERAWTATHVANKALSLLLRHTYEYEMGVRVRQHQTCLTCLSDEEKGIAV
jgi:hypothetical protein